MYIHELYQTDKPVLSYEVFPPQKGNNIETIEETLAELTALRPSFVSVTYGAGGIRDTSKKSIAIAEKLKNQHEIEALFHLTCANATKPDIKELLTQLTSKNITNILALGGDAKEKGALGEDYPYAIDLIREIKAFGGFGIGAAAYPEGHIQCTVEEDNYTHLLEKEKAGADFFITQLFFKNSYFYDFINKARRRGVSKPIVAGIMPILGRSQVERMIFMCGVSLPTEVIKLLYRYGDSPQDLRKAGIEYALHQAEELMENGVDGVHIYTMNQSDIAKAAFDTLHHRTL